MLNLSKAAYQIDGQPMFKVLDKVQRLEREGRKILHFELSEPDFNHTESIEKFEEFFGLSF
jgi:aspartate aminotransferase